MKFICPLLVTQDMEKSRQFYTKILGLRVISDYGANITFSGGLALQTAESWTGFIEKSADALLFGGNTHEIYFEEDEIDEFAQKIEKIGNIDYVHNLKEHPWGQKVIRFYDPDKHIIEVGESMQAVCKRLLKNGISMEETIKKTMQSATFVKKCLEIIKKDNRN